MPFDPATAAPLFDPATAQEVKGFDPSSAKLDLAHGDDWLANLGEGIRHPSAMVSALKKGLGIFEQKFPEAAKANAEKVKEFALSPPEAVQNVLQSSEQAFKAAPAGSLEEKLAMGGEFAGNLVAPLTTPTSIALTAVAPAKAAATALAPALAVPARVAAAGAYAAGAAPMAEEAGATAGEASVEPTPANVGKALAASTLALLGGVGAAHEAIFSAKPVFTPGSKGTLDQMAMMHAQERAMALSRAAESERQANHIRSADFLAARAEEIRQDIEHSQIGTEESTTFENPITAQEAKLDVGGFDATRERSRLAEQRTAATPDLSQVGEIPAGVELSPQASRMMDQHGGIDPAVMLRLGGTAGGAAYGAATGDTPEEKLERSIGFGALGYLAGKFGPTLAENAMGLGAGLAKRLDIARRNLAGETVPRTSAASEDSANALVAYASAPVAAKLDAAYRAGQVLGDHAKDPVFSQKLGAVLVEDRLNAIRQGFVDAAAQAKTPAEAADFQQKAANVGSVIGAPGSPLATSADYQGALEDPEITAAIARHKEIVQPLAEELHLKTGGQVARPGLDTGAFVNLKAILGDEEVNAVVNDKKIPTGGRQGDLTNPMQRRTAFGQRAGGTGQQYELDYDTIAQRMVQSNYEEGAKRDLYAQLEKDGLAEVLPPGQKPSESLGEGVQKIPIEPRSQGEPAMNLWVRGDISKEVMNALNTRGALTNETVAQVSKALNLVQLTGPTDAVFHSANLVSALTNVPRAGNVLANIALKLPGVNVGQALVRLAQSRARVIENSPAVQAELVNLAKIGALRPEHTGFISTLDKVGRLALNTAFDDLVAGGLAPETDAARRDFVNQVGQYNSRLQENMPRIAKELGLSPFIVAGTNFNRMGIRALTGAPGVATVSTAAKAKLWAQNIAGIVAGSVVVPSTVNYLTTGKVGGRDGTPVGAIDTGKDDENGKHIIIDPLKWTNVRRGARITGLDALLNGLKNDKDPDRIGGEMVRDIVWGQAHPWIGPMPQAAVTAVTGSSPTGFRQSEELNPHARFPTVSQDQSNLKGAFEQSYPLYGATAKAGRAGTNPVAEILKSLGGAIGVRDVADYSPEQARAESALETAQRSAQAATEQSRDEFARINALPAKERAAPLLRLRAARPQLFDKVLNEFEYQERGMSPAQRVIARLPIENGARAHAIASELAHQNTPEQKSAYLKGLIETGVLTDDVSEQVSALIGH